MKNTLDYLMDAGIAAANNSDSDLAITFFQKAVDTYPASIEAKINLGSMQWSSGNQDAALMVFKKVVALQPDNPHANVAIGVILAEQDQLDEAIISLERGLRGAPAAHVYNNLGLLYRRRGDRQAALRAFEKGLRLEPDDWLLAGNRGMELLVLGRFAEGWEGYEKRRYETNTIYEIDYGLPHDSPRWRGQAVSHLLVHYEQGFGDTMQNCRYVQNASDRCDRLTLVVPASLQSLMQTSWAHNARVTVASIVPKTFDSHVWVDSLPMIFRAGIEPIPNRPYLSVPRSSYWADRMAALPGRKVGLVWSGGGRSKINERRSITFATYLPLLDVPNISFVSLQKDREGHDPRLHDFTNELSDWADTAALVQELDLIITVDTAVAHLAGAINKPVWMLNRYDTCWRWLLDAPTTEWYPTMRIFRQSVSGDWTSVIAKIKLTLAQ